MDPRPPLPDRVAEAFTALILSGFYQLGGASPSTSIRDGDRCWLLQIRGEHLHAVVAPTVEAAAELFEAIPPLAWDDDLAAHQRRWIACALDARASTEAQILRPSLTRLTLAQASRATSPEVN